MVNAVILAGTPKDSSELIKGKNKSFLSIRHKLVIDYVMNAIEQSRNVERAVVVGPKEGIKSLDFNHKLRYKHIGKGYDTVEESSNQNGWKRFLENLINGYKIARKDDEKVLFLPGDMPLVKAEHLDDFINKCLEYEKENRYDAYYAYVDNSKVKREYPGHERRGFMAIEDGIWGEFRPGNFVLANLDKVKEKERLARGFYYVRKLSKPSSWLMMAHIAGYKDTARFFYRYVKRILTMDDVQDYFSRALGTRLKLVKSKYSQLEFDIDNESDLDNLTYRLEYTGLSKTVTVGRRRVDNIKSS